MDEPTRNTRRKLVTPEQSPPSPKMDHLGQREVPLEQEDDPPLSKTVTMSDISMMRAKTYQNVSIFAKNKKRYQCDMCDFKISGLLTIAISHLKKTHLETESQNTKEMTSLSQRQEKSVTKVGRTDSPKKVSINPSKRSRSLGVDVDGELVRMWKCNICGQLFKSKENLAKHTNHSHIIVTTPYKPPDGLINAEFGSGIG